VDGQRLLAGAGWSAVLDGFDRVGVALARYVLADHQQDVMGRAKGCARGWARLNHEMGHPCMKIAVFAGDGIGPEVTREALRVLDALALAGIELEYGDVGGVAYRNQGHPLPETTLELRAAPMASCLAPWVISIATICRAICARAGHSGSAQGTDAVRQSASGHAVRGHGGLSALRPEVAREIDLLIVRELNGDVYFGEKGTRTLEDGRRQGWDMMSYAEDEVRRIAHAAFRAAQGRQEEAVQRGQGQCAGNQPAVARCGDRGFGGIPRC
jgi:hypothetical protein